MPHDEVYDPPDDKPNVSLQLYWELEGGRLSELTRRQYAIVKESWLHDSHGNESEVFSTVKDQFGVPRVLCSKRFGQENIMHRAGYWSLSGDEPAPSPPKRQHLTRTIYLTQGRDIHQLESPRKLVEVILHAMIGLSCHVSLVTGAEDSPFPFCRTLGPAHVWMAAS
jgi:hypothetical protein